MSSLAQLTAAPADRRTLEAWDTLHLPAPQSAELANLTGCSPYMR